jgi:hypothetical protein
MDPEHTNKAYIEKIRQNYYSDKPHKTFQKNWNTSVAEYHAGKT